MSTAGQLLIETITHAEPGIRDRSARELIAGFGLPEKLRACEELEQFRRTRSNLYERVRASLFLHALYRYEIQDVPDVPGTGLIPFDGFRDLMERRYEQAIAAGGKVSYPINNAPYGERIGGVTDPFGNTWYVATPLKAWPGSRKQD